MPEKRTILLSSQLTNQQTDFLWEREKSWKNGSEKAKSDHDASLSVFRHFNCINAAFPITHPDFGAGYCGEIRDFARSTLRRV